MTRRDGQLDSRRRWRTAVACIVLGLTMSIVDPDTARAADAPIARSPEFTQRVDRLKTDGAERLEALVAGRNFGDARPEVAYLGLRSCGVPANHRLASAAYLAMYHAAASRDFGMERRGVACLAVAQDGVESVAARALGDRVLRLSSRAEFLGELAKSIVDAQRPQGAWAGTDDGLREDSTVVVGLEAAARAGVAVPDSVWTKALRRFLRAQEDKPDPSPRSRRERGGRGWRCESSARVADAWTTCAGIAAVAACRDALLHGPRPDPTLDAEAAKSIADGVAWLADEWSPFSENLPVCAAAVERAAGLLGLERIGGCDWYDRGVQGFSASWAAFEKQSSSSGLAPIAGYDSTWETADKASWALVFLGRPTKAARSRAFDGSSVDFVAADAFSDADFDEFVGLLLARAASLAAPERDELLVRLIALGPRVVPPLVKRLDSTDVEERARCFALLHRATGLDHGYSAALIGAAREAAVERWQAWWFANAKKLRFDAATGRLVAD